MGRRLVSAGHLDTPDQVFHLAKTDVLMFVSGEWDGRGRASWQETAPSSDGCGCPSLRPRT
jgi:hypothetical protein